ncbi:MAG: metalloregulator ArsR/SmtB family transcription factor [Aequorivita sp.]|nr:metalloregulator ArsR/SmtB family transcription factor [Aequorivita sp.]
MTDKKIFELHADVCKALGHPLRIEIIDLLQEKEQCFSDILNETGVLKSNLSQHLSVMTKKGILKTRRDGQSSYFSLSSEKVAKACLLMREVLLENLQEQQKILHKLNKT